ncbi:putative Branched-chain amino acid ABC transporter (Permease protein) livH-like protein [uncultured Spirochaetota bacterium]|jgi:branched-chain amino acid transport system permease protein|nr:putative Branched-chain amino acid ABC transporter (Permease protein) livH-like protein [uncultured Spirochaetota bacterium]
MLPAARLSTYSYFRKKGMMVSQIAQLIVSGVLAGGLYGIISVGLTLIFGVLNLVNFAHGEFLMISMYISFWMSEIFNLNPYMSLPIVVAAMFVFGIIIQSIFIRPVTEASHEVQIVITLGLSTIMQNSALMAFSGNLRVLRTPFSESMIEIAGIFINTQRLLTFTLAILATIILYLYLTKSYFGKAIRATAQDSRAAKLAGINVPFVYMITYGIGIALVGLAGASIIPLFPVYPTIGWHFANIAFVAVVLGGLGSIPGAMVGGIIIGLIESIAGFYFGSEFQQAAYFIVFIIILIIRPTGLFRK